MTEQITKENYFNVGKIEDKSEFKKENLILSNSTLSYLNAEEGGSINKFINYLIRNNEEEETKSLTRGKLLHKFIENRDEFIISTVDKPSDKLGEVADIICNNIQNSEIIRNTIEVEGFETTINNLIIMFCRQLNWNPKWGDDAILKNTKDKIVPYVEEVLKGNGKIIITKSDKVIIENCITSLTQNETIYKLLFQHIYSEDCKIEVEEVIDFEYLTYKFKAMIDRLIIDNTNKIIYIIDLKTTGKNVYQFNNAIEFYHYYRQQFIYKQAIYNKYKDLIANGYTMQFYFVVVETFGIYECAVVNIDNMGWSAFAEDEIKELILILNIYLLGFTSPIEPTTQDFITFKPSINLTNKRLQL